MKKLFLFLFVFFQLSLFGQENPSLNKSSFSIDIDRSFNTSGDYWMYHYKNEYRYSVFEHFGFGVGLGIALNNQIINSPGIRLLINKYQLNLN